MSQLTIYKASAGSGKTFRLVAEYLKLLVRNPYQYKHILAVTFTNKATTEMKERILRDLFKVASGTDNTIIDLLKNETGLNTQELIQNASQALSLILHDYDRFSVSTIDSFFQGILRSFARESGLYGSYEIDLDRDSVLEEACDRMLLSVESDQELRDWLLMMSENQLEEGQNWQIRDRISELGRELDKDTFTQYRVQQGSLSEERKKLKELKSELIKTMKWFESECNRFGNNGLASMQKHNLSTDDFKYKKTSFANAFNKLSAFRGGEIVLGSRFLNAPDNPDAWPSSKESASAVLACYHDGMNELVHQVIDFIDKHALKYYTAASIFKNIYALGVLSTLAIFVREVGQDNNSLLLSESDTLLRGIIGNNDAPFIYEKAGNFYQYFMIDEFQDTSDIQWSNFKPLIENSLSENHPDLVVGDVKQSIYRWRNSNWRLLESGLKTELKKFGVKEKNLDQNWRSCAEIVEFNNLFFSKAPSILQNRYNEIATNENHGTVKEEYLTAITSAFHDVVQEKASGKTDGYIQLKLIESENKAAYRKETIKELITEIEKIQDSGYKASDIAILVRKNSQGNEIANALIRERIVRNSNNYNFEVISDDSLFLSSSASVRFLSGMMKYVTAPWDQITKKSVVYQYYHHIIPFIETDKPLFENSPGDKENEYRFIPPEFEKKYFPFFEEKAKNPVTQRWATLSIIDLEKEFESRFLLPDLPGEQASLQTFRDVIIDFSKKEGGNLHKFIEWWEQNGNKVKVQTSVERDAIRILSIHKAKGLEFPIVLIPFCDWKFEPDATKSNILWCPTENMAYSNFPVLPVTYSKMLRNTAFAPSYYTEMLLSFIDNLNLMYVAFTRAVNGLYIYTEVTKTGNSAGSLFNELTGKDGVDEMLQQQDDSLFTKGRLPVPLKTALKSNEINLSGKIEHKRNIGESLRIHNHYDDFFDTEETGRNGKINEGKVIHELLSHITVHSDIESSVNTLINEGKLDVSKSKEIISKLTDLMKNPSASEWFNGSYRVMNETTIISPGFELKRPDRIMIKDNKVVVVDYKFTSQVSKSHQQQVKDYVERIREMGTADVEGYIWYLKTNRVLNSDDIFS